MKPIRITLIAAVSRDLGIGTQGRLPWHLPEDLKRFRARTRGHPVVLGRKTLESIGRALPDRPNFVISRNPSRHSWPAGDIRAFADLWQALEAAKQEARALGREEIFVIGGGEIYAQALPRADRLDLTEVDITLGAAADAFFPVWDSAEFREISREEFPVSLPERPLGFVVRVLERRHSA